MSDDGKCRPAENKAASDTSTLSVPKRREWKPDPRNVRGLDRHIRRCYGERYTWARWSA